MVGNKLENKLFDDGPSHEARVSSQENCVGLDSHRGGVATEMNCDREAASGL